MANENLVLEHLRHIRGRVDQIGDAMSDVKHRLTSLERGQGMLMRDAAGQYEDQARQQSTIDRIIERLNRIARRLELNES